ncbi:unnamed protein product [Symbiodinium pilosum]|uniref:Uncharacterized protein n=1 Tax=Symbiodinium pilosum TaxID=2952 RepID=A0A812XXL6_SYMPI|nr:unnamed protein product [Symbiodinium pilosum]
MQWRQFNFSWGGANAFGRGHEHRGSIQVPWSHARVMCQVAKTAAFQEAKRSFAVLSAARSMEDMAIASSKVPGLVAERQACWHLALRESRGLELPGVPKDSAPNPFLASLRAMLNTSSTSIRAVIEGQVAAPRFRSLDARAFSADTMASWMLRECRAASYPTLLEDAGLLPPQVKPPPAPVRTKPQLQEVPSQKPAKTEGSSSMFASFRQMWLQAQCF